MAICLSFIGTQFYYIIVDCIQGGSKSGLIEVSAALHATPKPSRIVFNGSFVCF